MIKETHYLDQNEQARVQAQNFINQQQLQQAIYQAQYYGMYQT